MLHPDKNIASRINHWLNGAYDEVTKASIHQLVEAQEFDTLTDAFTAIWNLAREAYVVSWVWVRTG